MTRTQIIQALIDKNGYTSYLEIGVQGGVNFKKIQCQDKVGVDPDKDSRATVHKTSDDFFKTCMDTFDIVFVDGLHHAEAVERDINNSLAFLREGGTIVCHDCIPLSEVAQRVPRESKDWNGDCWRAWVKFKSTRADLQMYVVNTDHGCGIIKKGSQELIYVPNDISYELFFKNQKGYLNTISVEQFKHIHS